MPLLKMKFLSKKWRAKKRNRLLQQVIPVEERENAGTDANSRASKSIARPGFSLPLMTTNFRRFNARYEASDCHLAISDSY